MVDKLFLREQWATIGLGKYTKVNLDKNRALGQYYDGFICQLIDLWEKTKRRNQFT